MKELGDHIKEIKIFPRYLGDGIFVTFGLFISSAFIDSAWLANSKNQIAFNDPFVTLPFMVAVASFFLIGAYAIFEIYGLMKGEFEDIKKRQKEAKEYKPVPLSEF